MESHTLDARMMGRRIWTHFCYKRLPNLIKKHIKIRPCAQESQKVALFSKFGLLFSTLLACFCGHGSILAPSGDVTQPFWIAFAAFARLEPPGQPFQHHFEDLASFVIPFLTFKPL